MFGKINKYSALKADSNCKMMFCKINFILPNIYFTNLYSTGSIVLEEHLSRRITSGLKPKSRWQWEAWDSELQVTTPQLLTPHLSSPHTP